MEHETPRPTQIPTVVRQLKLASPMIEKEKFRNDGFITIDNIYTSEEIELIVNEIEQVNTDKETFRKTSDLFAIRQFLKEVPSTLGTILNENLKRILTELLGKNYFPVKSIYFNKPASSNWYVSYHQDLTISVDRKVDLPGFSFWTVKHNQFAVQPPIEILENIVTVRVHLDNTDEENGALKVIPGSHLKSIYRPETINWKTECEVSCNVHKGGIMIMKPLLLHSSGRTVNNKQRRVIHIEFSNMELPEGLNWSEKMILN